MNPWDRASNVVPIVFAAVMGSNVLSMSLMNFFEARTSSVPIVYLACFALLLVVILRCRVTYPSLSKAEHLFCASFGLLLFLPRSGYLIEGLLGYSLVPLGDDPFHVPNLASIIHTQQFPPRSTYDSTQYLAYYYAAWMPGAVLYYAGLAVTVKQALALTKLLYCCFIAYFPFYAAKVLFEDPRQRRAFLVLCLAFGGFDFLYWAFSLNFVPRHSEWWAEDFGFTLQFSNFITLALWTPQHLLAALAILLALYIIGRSSEVLAHGLVGLLVLSAVFSSPFTTFGSIPLAMWYFIKKGRWSALPPAALVFVVVSLPLWWILLGNGAVGFQAFGALHIPVWQSSKRAAFAVFLLIIALELWPLIVAAGWFVIRRNRELLWPLGLSLMYILSTFFCFFSENYSMRGSIIPIFTLIYLATPVVDECCRKKNFQWVHVALAAYLLGGVLEYASFSRTAILEFQQSKTAFNGDALRSNEARGAMATIELTQKAAEYPSGWGILEKHKPVPKDPLTIDEARCMHPDNCYRVTISRIREGRAFCRNNEPPFSAW